MSRATENTENPAPACSSTVQGDQVNFQHDAGALPTYEEVSNPNAPPPTYDSLFGRVKDVKKSSNGILDFLKNIVILLLGTIGCTVILGFSFLVPIAMIVIGSIYVHDCPACEYIPIYLIVSGVFGILKQLLHLSTRVKKNEDHDEENLRESPLQTLISCFMLGWFIIGSVWIYKEYEPDYNPSHPKYCNEVLYTFAFWLTTSAYIIIGIITMCFCSIIIACIAFQKDS